MRMVEKPIRIAWCSDEREYPYFNRFLVEHVRRAGHDVQVIHGWRDLEQCGDDFDLGVLRTRDAPEDPECCDVALELESRGLPFVNSMSSRQASKDKLSACAAFARADIPQPAWAYSPVSAVGLKGPVIVKPRFGGRQEGLRIFDSIEKAMADGVDFEQSLVEEFVAGATTWRVIATPERTLRAFRKRPLPPAARWLVEQYSARRQAASSSGAEARGLVPPGVRRTVVSVASDFMTVQGDVRIPGFTPPEVNSLARSMVRALDGDLMGADLLVTKHRLLALELNTNFGVPLNDWRLMRRFVEELSRRATSSEPHRVARSTT